MTLTQFLKPMVPPLLWSAGRDLKRRLSRSVDHYEYAPAGWHTPLPAGGGNEAYWRTFVPRERAAFEALLKRMRAGDPELTPDAETMKFIFFGYVAALASRCRDTLSVLDYGGNLGEYYWIARALLPDVDLDYHCRELDAVAMTGRQLSPDVVWHTGDACLAGSYDVVMFSSSLQYLPDWTGTFRQAAQAARAYLVLSDIPAVIDAPTFVITQRTGGAIHLQYVFNRAEIVDAARRAGLRLVREFLMGPHPTVRHAPEQPVAAAWLFAR